jgi:CheY-like chemotaxis protein
MYRILVAEDDGAVRAFVARALARQGHDVTAVEDASQALAALAEGEFDLLLTDIVMPGMDGIALALKVAKSHPRLPVVLMSGYAAERQRAHNLETLIRRVIAKPFTLKEICAVVRESLADRAPRDKPTRH